MAKRLSSERESLNIAAVIDFFGGRAALSQALEKHGILQISIYAIDKWRLRGAIPPARIADLETLARKLRKKFRVADFYVQRGDAPKKKAA